MSNLVAARCQMGMSLGFHIIFAVVGIAMPLMMVIAEWMYRRTGDEVYLTLTRRWATGTAIMFAVGAVSGTVLSFELGLLWPHFMKWAGAIIGMPFSLEGFAFFTEAIFLGVYLYAWDRVSSRAHIAAGVVVSFSGALSGVFVVIANSWMNTPTGFRLVNGKATDINPLLGMINPAMPHEVIHMMIAAYVATGFAVAGIHAAMLLRDPGNPFHRRAIAIAFSIGAIAALGQPISGDFAARAVAKLQPIKLAAFEGLFPTESHAPIAIGGIPDVKDRKLLYAIELPDMLSLMTYHNADAVVRGLDSFPEKDWPDPLIAVHLAFQVMVGLGFAMVGMALWAGLLLWRRHTIFDSKLFLLALVGTAPFGLIAVEAGWIVTEVGRQPWIIYGVMRTAQAVTPMPGLIGTFSMFTTLYLILAGTVVYMMWRQVLSSPTTEELAAAAAAGR